MLPPNQSLARQWKPTAFRHLFAPLSHTVTALASSVPHFDSHAHCYACGHCSSVCAECVLRVRVCVCAGLCIRELEPHTSAVLFFFCSASCCCRTYHAVRITPSLKLSSCPICGRSSKGTTAVAHEVLGLSFVTGTDGASGCMCHVSYGNQDVLSREV